ncbi:MAG: peroxide stress protein YaaA [Rubrivivax sp.]|nr:peroxide stress protein YaaA [Rubrivivax sp.]
MLFLLSPAKSLDYDTPVPASLRRKATEPLFTEEAAALIEVLRPKTPAQVASLMDLSDKLAGLAVARYAAWHTQATARNSKPAVLAFDGDVYDGLDAGTLGSADLGWAQQHLVILSGLYGALRPLDRLQPYRLEMGTALATERGKDLYAWWGDTVAAHLNQRQAGQVSPVVVNLASVEYSRVALRPALRARVVDCVFEETQPDGSHRIVSFYAKKARGLMARFAVLQRARSVKALEAFDAEGYALVRAASSPQRLVFRRAARRAGLPAPA